MSRAKPSPFAHGRSEFWERKATVQAIDREQHRLATRLRDLRAERKLTQAQAAEAAGVHVVQIARLEAGRANTTVATLVALAGAYGVTVGQLFRE